jgi:tRNA(fMet)-specific endonuclease VapC
LTYLLDTNTCVEYLNGRPRRVLDAFQRRTPEDIAVCSIVKAELHYGALRSKNPLQAVAKLEEFLAPFRSLPFDDQCTAEYGRIRARLAQTGLLIGPNDLLIAAIAVVHDAILVTHNTREFIRVEGLAIEDWET